MKTLNKITSKCIVCKNTFQPTKINPGYGVDNHDHKICLSCCGKLDAKKFKNAKPGDKLFAYYNHETNTISNWPGTFEIKSVGHSHGRHNIARTRISVWFKYEGNCFHGIQYGEDSEILYVKCVKPF